MLVYISAKGYVKVVLSKLLKKISIKFKSNMSMVATLRSILLKASPSAAAVFCPARSNASRMMTLANGMNIANFREVAYVQKKRSLKWLSGKRAVQERIICQFCHLLLPTHDSMSAIVINTDFLKRNAATLGPVLVILFPALVYEAFLPFPCFGFCSFLNSFRKEKQTAERLQKCLRSFHSFSFLSGLLFLQ